MLCNRLPSGDDIIGNMIYKHVIAVYSFWECGNKVLAMSGVSIKAGYGGLPPPVGSLTAICLDFINENKNDSNKKAYSTTPTNTEIFKCYKNSMLFDAQNAWNRISELLDFKVFWGNMPPDPPRGKGPYGPFSGHSRLLHLQRSLITKVIETPEKVTINSLTRTQSSGPHLSRGATLWGIKHLRRWRIKWLVPLIAINNRPVSNSPWPLNTRTDNAFVQG